MDEHQILPSYVTHGLDWGLDFLWVCMNDDCPLFVNGWTNMAEKYGQLDSIRYMVQPDTGEAGILPVVHQRHPDFPEDRTGPNSEGTSGPSNPAMD
jgi:hypothetical protein